MTQTLEKCQNCQKEFPEQKIATHFGYCRRNIKRCTQCGQMFDINSKEQHEEQFHKKVACQFCKKQFGIAQLEKHKNVCTLRTKFCQYCDLNVPINQFSTHLKACQSRTKKCDKCTKPITNKDYLVHLTTCKGIVEQANSYEQYLKNQKERQQARQQFARNQSKPITEKNGIQMKKREIPNTGVTNNYGVGGVSSHSYGITNNKPSIGSTNPTTGVSRPQVINTGATNSINIASNQRVVTNNQPYQPQSYNPTTNVQQKEYNGVKNYQNDHLSRNEPKHQVRDVRAEYKNQYRPQNKNNNPVYNYNNYNRNDNKNEIRPDIRYDVKDNKDRNDGRMGSRNKITTENRTGSYEQRAGTGSSNRIEGKNQYKNDYIKNDVRKHEPISNADKKPYQNIKKQSPVYNNYYNAPPSSKHEYKHPTQVPIQPSPQIPSTGYNKIKKEAVRKQEKVITFDPKDYGGYSDQIPPEILQNNHNSNARGGHEEDQMFQRAILQSMSQNTKKVPVSKKGLPKQLESAQLMETSFYKDYDEQKQRAIYEQIQKNAKKNRR